jgi:hypothetical protein
LIKVGLFI